MKLQNPFSKETRELFRDLWECWECGENGQRTGGLELHHITGRDSNSPFNAAILCKGCHARAIHTHDEEAKYTETTARYLYRIGYRTTEKDIQHLIKHPWLVTERLANWTKSLPEKTGVAHTKYDQQKDRGNHKAPEIW